MNSQGSVHGQSPAKKLLTESAPINAISTCQTARLSLSSDVVGRLEPAIFLRVGRFSIVAPLYYQVRMVPSNNVLPTTRPRILINWLPSLQPHVARFVSWFPEASFTTFTAQLQWGRPIHYCTELLSITLDKNQKTKRMTSRRRSKASCGNCTNPSLSVEFTKYSARQRC